MQSIEQPFNGSKWITSHWCVLLSDARRGSEIHLDKSLWTKYLSGFSSYLLKQTCRSIIIIVSVDVWLLCNAVESKYHYENPPWCCIQAHSIVLNLTGCVSLLMMFSESQIKKDQHFENMYVMSLVISCIKKIISDIQILIFIEMNWQQRRKEEINLVACFLDELEELNVCVICIQWMWSF